MARVKMLQAMAGPYLSYIAGDHVLVSDEIAAAWKAGGVAEEAPPHIEDSDCLDHAKQSAYVPGEAAPAAPAVVPIPNDWQDLSAADLKTLASKLTTDTVPNKATAVAIVQAEVDRRAAAADLAGQQ